jgi:two-component system NarL family response regulator
VFIEDEEIALLKAGAKGCCRRGIDPDSLQQVLSVTANGGVWVTRSLLPAWSTNCASTWTRIASRPRRRRTMSLAELTQREREIVRLIVEGASNKEVASSLNISERTVKGHLSNVFQKLGVSDRLKLVLFVREGKVAGSAPGPQALRRRKTVAASISAVGNGLRLNHLGDRVAAVRHAGMSPCPASNNPFTTSL